MLTNALIRIEGRRKALPPPFELVVPSRHVWLLEFSVPKKAERDQVRWLIGALARKKLLLSRYSIAKDARLYLAFSSRKPGPRFLDPGLIRAIAALKIGLEIYQDVPT